MNSFPVWLILKRIAKLTIVYILVTGTVINAEPYLAVRTGSQCSRCHVNMSGGGKRTDFGNIYAQRFLNGKFISHQVGNNFTPQISRTVSIGANLRMRNTVTFGYTDTTLGTVVKDEYFLDMTEGNFYIEVRLIPDYFTFYIDNMVSPNPGNREAFALLKGLPGKSYFKVGKILLPYGLRLWDDEAFIRETTGFTYSDPELAAEIGFEPGNYSTYMAITSNQVSGLAVWVRRHGRLGVSWQKSIDGTANRMFGSFFGLHAGRITILGEADQIELATGIKQRTYFTELNLLLMRGYNLKFSYHLFNRNLDVSLDRDGQERFTVGFETFPFQFFQIAVFYTVNRFIPQNFPLNQNSVVVELHFFF